VSCPLEIIDTGAATREHPTPLVFVHGTSHGAWCWEEHFLGYFARHGYRAVAVSLRGHGRSPVSTSLRRVSLADYVDDVRCAVSRIGDAPVLIGHSLGGFVVMQYLRRYESPAAVLAASAPPFGQWGTLSRTIRRHPGLMMRTVLRGKFAPDLSRPDVTRSFFFSPDVAEHLVRRYASCLQEESDRALLECMFRAPRIRPRAIPMLVLAAENDAVFTARETAATARAYGADWQLIPDLAHDLMLDTRWRRAADTLLHWLIRHGF
jgi:pimeloyl-ACP methyl ester carboxylesterase